MELLIVLITLLPAFVLARIPLKKILGSRLDPFAIDSLALAAGLGLLSQIMLALGLLHLFKTPILWGVIALLYAGCLALLRRDFIQRCAIDARKIFVAFKKNSPVNQGLLCFAAFLVLCNLAGAYIPQTGDDALYYHFALPKIFIQQGGLVFVPDNFTSLWPFNIEMLFTLGMLLAGEAAATLFNVIIGVAFSLMIYQLIKMYLGHPAGLFWGVVSYSTPLVLTQSNKGFVDMGTGLFALCGLYLMLQMIRDKKWDYKITAGIFFGLAAGTKIVGALTGVLTALSFVLVYFRELKTRALLMAALLLVLTGLIASPWIIRSFALTGNPVYPALYSVFGGKGWDQKVEARTKALTNSSDIALAPLGWSVQGAWLPLVFLHYPQLVISRLNQAETRSARPDLGYLTLLFLPFSLVFIIRQKPLFKEVLFMTLTAGLFVLFWYFCLTQVTRYLLPVLGILYLYSAFGLHEILSSSKFRWLKTVTIGSIALWFLGSLGIYFSYYAPKAYGIFHREQYLLDYGYFRPMVNWVNTHLGPQDKIALLSEIGPYVFDVPYTHPGPGFHLYDFQDAQSLQAFLVREKITHLFVARDSSGRFLDERGTVNPVIYLFRQDGANPTLADLLRDTTKTVVVYSQEHTPVIGKSPLVLAPPIQVTVYRLLN